MTQEFTEQLAKWEMHLHQLGYRKVVLCKECKFFDPEDHECDCGHSIRWQTPRPDDWYCADAERRTDND